MFYRRAREYIIAYKMMRQKKTLEGPYIDLFIRTSVDNIYNIVKDFNTHRFSLDFDRLFLFIIVHENR